MYLIPYSYRQASYGTLLRYGILQYFTRDLLNKDSLTGSTPFRLATLTNLFHAKPGPNAVIRAWTQPLTFDLRNNHIDSLLGVADCILLLSLDELSLDRASASLKVHFLLR